MGILSHKHPIYFPLYHLIQIPLFLHNHTDPIICLKIMLIILRMATRNWLQNLIDIDASTIIFYRINTIFLRANLNKRETKLQSALILAHFRDMDFE